MPMHSSARVVRQPAAQRGEKVLQRRPGGRLHQQLRALEPGSARDEVRHRIEDAHIGGRPYPRRPLPPETHGGVPLPPPPAQPPPPNEQRRTPPPSPRAPRPPR